MENVTESIEMAFNSPKPNGCGVLNRDGIFYATLRVQGETLPFEIALHGVASEQEALQAFATLARLRHVQCDLPEESF